MRRALRVAYLLSLPALLSAGESARDVLEKRCFGCHGAARMSGLDLRERERGLRGGKRGPALVPSRPDDSLLFRAVSGNAGIKMPPGKESLSESERMALRQWIESGADWVRSARTAEPSWWSFREVKRPSVPEGAANPVDA